MKNHISPYVELKTVTWCKDSHGLFDYESSNVHVTKDRVDTSSRVYFDGNDISIKGVTKFRPMPEESASKDPNYLFSITADKDKNDTFYLQFGKKEINDDENNSNKLFLVVRSLKNDDGTQKGYNLELGDIIRLGRIEYRVIEYQNHNHQVYSLLKEHISSEACPFKLLIKNCNGESNTKKQCRICLMDEQDVEEELLNPCNCKGTSEYVHIQCLQDWIISKLKKKMSPDSTCFYWKKLNCEVCKVPLPDMVEIKDSKKELVPLYRPEGPYILLERVFYDKNKENADNAKMMILLNLADETQQIKLGRGHLCDLRENDISVSRLHASIKYQDGHFNISDNKSKFGTLVLARKNLKLEKNKKIALQFGRTVTTFVLKQAATNTIPMLRNPIFMENLTKWQTSKNNFNIRLKPSIINYNKTKNTISPSRIEAQSDSNLNESFLD